MYMVCEVVTFQNTATIFLWVIKSYKLWLIAFYAYVASHASYKFSCFEAATEKMSRNPENNWREAKRQLEGLAQAALARNDLQLHADLIATVNQ